MLKCVDPVQIWEAGLLACAEVTDLEFLKLIDVNELLGGLDFADRACYIFAELFLAKPTLPYTEDVEKIEKLIQDALSFIDEMTKTFEEGDTLLEWLLSREKENEPSLPIAEVISVKQKLNQVYREIREKLRLDKNSFEVSKDVYMYMEREREREREREKLTHQKRVVCSRGFLDVRK